MRANTPGMAALLLRHAGRRLRKEWGRAALLLTAVGLGIAVFVAVLYASDASVRSFRDSIASIGGEDSIELRAHSGALSAGDLAVLYPGLRRQFDTLAFWEGRGEALGKPIDIVAVDPGEGASRLGWAGPEATEGSFEDAWWGTSRLINRLGAEATARPLTVTFGAEKVSLPLRLLPEDVARRVSGDVILTSLSAVARVREPGKVTGVTLYPRSTEPLHLVTALGQFLEGGKDRRLYLANPRQRAAQAERLFAAFQLNIGVLVLMTLLVCAFVVFGAAQLSVVTLQRELGIMRTIGFSRPLVGAVIISESLIVGLLGTVIGLTVGRPVTEWCAGLFLKSVSVLYAGGARPENLWGRSTVEVFVWSFAVGVGLCVVGAALPALRASRTAPGIVARSRGFIAPSSSRRLHRSTIVALGGAFIFAWLSTSIAAAWAAHLAAFCVIGAILGGSWWLLEVLASRLRSFLGRTTGVPGLLAAANVISGSRVVGVAVAANGVGLSLLIGLGLMVSSFRFTLVDWIDYTIRGDLFVRSVELGSLERPARLPLDFEALAENVPGIKEVSGFASFEFDAGNGFITIGGQHFSSHPKARAFHFLSGRPLGPELTGTNSVVISESAGRKLGVTVGDSITVAGVSAQVEGVFKDYSSEHGIVLFELANFRRLFGALPLTSAVLIAEEGENISTIAQALTESPIGATLSVQRNGELRNVILSIFDQTFQITDLMRFIVAVICALGFILTALQLHEERRVEIRTLMTLGLSRLGLQGSVILEGLLMLSPGLILGSIGGTALALILIHLVNPLSFGWTLNFVPTVAQYGGPIVIVLFSNLIAAALVALRSAALTPKRESEDE